MRTGLVKAAVTEAPPRLGNDAATAESEISLAICFMSASTVDHGAQAVDSRDTISSSASVRTPARAELGKLSGDAPP